MSLHVIEVHEAAADQGHWDAINEEWKEMNIYDFNLILIGYPNLTENKEFIHISYI